MSAKPKKSCNAPRCIYNRETVKKAVRLSQFFRDEGIPVKGNRAVATWRGGEHESVSIDDEKGVWNDHKAGEGGDVITAYAKIHDVSPLAAIRALGERYQVAPTKVVQKTKKLSRAEMLLAEGYSRAATYTYTDENGAYLYSVDRYEKPIEDGKHDKSFVQRHGDVENIKGVRRVLYNLPQVLAAANVYVVEGEKDVETLRKLGIVATTNSGGAKFWQEDFNAAFTGKAVIIIADNDAPGLEHAEKIARQLVGVAKSVKVLTISKLPKGDVTDWIEREEGTVEKLRELVAAAAEYSPSSTITNYTESTSDKKTLYHARQQGEIRADIFKATGGWPRRVGGSLFAFQIDKSDPGQRYLTLNKPGALFSWLRENHTLRWKSGQGGAQDATGNNYVTMEQLHESIRANATTYAGISRAPHWPLRTDQFYDVAELPRPSTGHETFWRLIDFFCLANDTYRLLAACLFCSPMYYQTTADNMPGATPKPLPRPLWIIDTVDAQGSGKSTLAKKVAMLYGSEILDASLEQLRRDPFAVSKRILSVEGRTKRVFMIDNVTGVIRDGTLASWVTASTLSGMAPYGHGEETRANDFCWIITVNGAEIDTDTASRAYTVKVRKREEPYQGTADDFGNAQSWEADVDAYINANRAQLFADVLDMLEHAKPRRSDSRFPAFDARVLSAVCQTDEEFEACRASIDADATGANVDAELVENFTEAVEGYLANIADNYSTYDPSLPSMLANAVVADIMRNAGGKLAEMKITHLRTLLKAGLSPKFSRQFNRLRATYAWRKESIVYGLHLIPPGATETQYQTIDLVPTSNGTSRPNVIHQDKPIKRETIK